MDRNPETTGTEQADSKRAIRRLGWICLTLIVLIGNLAIPLRCEAKAAVVGGATLLNGLLFGLALAAVTRTRRPGLIYLFLLAAAVLLLPLWFEWPPADQDDLWLWHGAPDILRNYFDFLRYGMFVLALPYPFARFGFHAPDPITRPESSETQADADQNSEIRQENERNQSGIEPSIY